MKSEPRCAYKLYAYRKRCKILYQRLEDFGVTKSIVSTTFTEFAGVDSDCIVSCCTVACLLICTGTA